MTHAFHPTSRNAIWCGKEGLLSHDEFIRRTEADIDEYARRQPLKFRLAMRACGRDAPSSISRALRGFYCSQDKHHA